MTYLSTDGIKLLLKQIPNKSRESIRDLAMLTLLYDTGCRVQELIDLKPSCIRFEYPCHIRVTSKGNKQRDIPLKKEQLEFLQQYIDEYNLNRAEFQKKELFFNRARGKLTTAGVTYILKKYADEARKENGSLIPKQISPHIIRHSKAMHLLQGGVNLVYIRDFLGHVSIQTTEIYARADSKQKREALESVYEDVVPEKGKKGSWENNDGLKDFLKSLGI
ncbi:tyrosine-type recombinase/integrase [Chryseobacterium artocarpi]|nr:tyrosine-type recombinase/integrase [Chryseobacterium artocarpi]